MVHVAKFHRFTDRDVTAIRGFEPHQDAKQCGFTHAVGTNNANDAAFRHREADVLEQQPITESFSQAADLDHLVSESRARWNVDFVGLVAGLKLLRIEFLKALQSRLVLGLPAFWVGAHPFKFSLDRFWCEAS